MGTFDPTFPSQRSTAKRAATLLMTLMSIGEMLVAVAILALPREVVQLLVDEVLDARGLIVARMMGVAVLALGLTWWTARVDADRLSRHWAGFIVYNLGVGALFGWAALAASRPALPWIVCVVHLAAAVAFAIIAGRNRS